MIASRPHWSEGLLLTHHHLQQQDRYHEGRVDAIVGALHPIPWGLAAITIDEAALARGELVISSLRAILPDGTPIAWDGPGPGAAPSRALSGPGIDGVARLGVHLALAEIAIDEPNLDDDEGGALRRFRARTQPATELTGRGPPATLEVLDPSPALLLGDEARSGQRSLRIAELVRRPDGAFAVADDHLPPALTIAAAPALERPLRRLFAAAARRRRHLLEGCARSEDRVEYRAAELDRHLMIHALGRLLPALRGLLEGPPASPRAAHTILAALVGELTSFSGDLDPATLPVYDHLDLRAAFAPLFREADRLLGIAVEREVLSVTLRHSGDGRFSAGRLDPAIGAATPVFLEISGDAELGRGEGLAELLKIAAGRRIDALVRSNSRGASARLLRRPPPTLAARAGALYLAIDAADPHWREVLQRRDLAIHASPPLDGGRLNLRLLALPGRNERSDGLAPATDPARA